MERESREQPASRWIVAGHRTNAGGATKGAHGVPHDTVRRY